MPGFCRDERNPAYVLIQIRAKDFDLTDDLRDRIERRVRLSLTRFSDRLKGVTVRIERRATLDPGDAQYVCSVALSPARLQITEEHDQMEMAIDRAVDRAGRLAGFRLSRTTS